MIEGKVKKITGLSAVKMNKLRAINTELTDYGFKLCQYVDGIDFIQWYERVLVPGSNSFDPLIICYNIEKDEFHLDPYNHVRFADFNRAKKATQAFAGAKIIAV